MTCPQDSDPTTCRACRAGVPHGKAPQFTWWSHDAGYPSVEAFCHDDALAEFRAGVLSGMYPNVPTFTYVSEDDVSESTSTVYTVK